MSRNGDYVAEHIYGPHLNNGRYTSNLTSQRTGLRYRLYLRKLTELACNRFKWEGLPPEIDPRYLEVTLFRNSLAVFFHSSGLESCHIDGTDPYNKYFALTGSPSGPLDMYDNANRFTVVGNSVMNGSLDIRNCVPIWANYLRMPDHDIVLTYAEQLAEFDVSINIAAKNMRNTNFVMATENQRLSVQNMIRQRDAGEPMLYLQKNGGLNPNEVLQAVDMKVHPDTLPKLMIAKSKLWNECMTMLGINNANQDKRERLVADEVAANDDQIDSFRQIDLNARQQACDEINDKFGLDVSVEFHSQETEEPLMLGGGGETNGDVHDGAAQGSGTD